MKELIEFMARAIVDNPDAVVVTEDNAGDHIVYHLHVADEDMGRVIGKQGRIANAMRTLLKVSAIRHGARAVLEIGEDRVPMRDDRRSDDDNDRRSDHGDERDDDERDGDGDERDGDGDERGDDDGNADDGGDEHDEDDDRDNDD